MVRCIINNKYKYELLKYIDGLVGAVGGVLELGLGLGSGLEF